MVMDVEKQPTKPPLRPKELDPSHQFPGWHLERKARPRLEKAIVRCAGFLIIFFIVKVLTNTNVESRTWLIPLKWPKFPLPHHRLTPSEREDLFLYVNTLAPRLYRTQYYPLALSQILKVLWKRLGHTQPILILLVVLRTFWTPKSFCTSSKMNWASPIHLTFLFMMLEQPYPAIRRYFSQPQRHRTALVPGSIPTTQSLTLDSIEAYRY